MSPLLATPDVSVEAANVARQMRAFARRGWYLGDEASLARFGARRLVRGATEPELVLSLTLSRDRMHHSVGWWRNAEYEYCWHLSMAAKVREAAEGGQETWAAAPFEQVPRAEARYWAHAVFRDHVDKLWFEPGGTDPRLTREEARAHATMWHLRLFLEPKILDARGEPFVPFIPAGEVYDLTRWIDGLTPEKVDR